MAKGLEKHQARLDAIQLEGKDLARRAKRKCELCEGADDLRPYDTDVEVEPSLGTLLLLCQRCRGFADGEGQDPRTLRFLEGAVWNQTPVVASLAHRLIKGVDTDWARDTLEMLPEEE